MSSVPATWEHAPIGDLLEVLKNGISESQNKEGRGIPVSRIETIASGNVNSKKIGFVESMSAHDAETYRLRNGDVLFSHINSAAHLGKTAIYRGDPPVLFHGVNLLLMRVRRDFCEPRYFEYGMRHLRAQGVFELQAQHSVNQASINQQKLRQIVLPIAPLAEQKRIADKLDRLLAAVDTCKARLNAIPIILKRFRQSVLAAATRGDLTEEWRKASGTGCDWPTVTLGSVALDFSYGSSAKSQTDGKLPVLRMGNIQDGSLVWDDLVYTSDPSEIDKYRLAPGDVLFNRTNSPELVGKTAVFGGAREAIYAGYLIRVRCTDKLLPNYLSYCLNSPAGRDYCWQVKTDGVSQSNINAKKLAKFSFPLPSVEEQHQIVSRVSELCAHIEGVKRRCLDGFSSAECLARSLLANAFRGALVGQNHAGEPIS